MVSIRVLAAVNGWFQSRTAEGATPNPKVVPLMALMFGTLDALYLETRKLPLKVISGARKDNPKEEPDVFTLGLFLNNHDYVTLRSILSLAGDLILVSEKLMTLSDILDLNQFIRPLHDGAEKFRDARNFFTHMDEALRDYSIHGISGPATLDCGVQFTDNAKSNVYLIWDKNTLYFSFKNKHRKVSIDRPAFDEIFNQSRQLYDAIISNPISQGAGTFMTGAQVYPP